MKNETEVKTLSWQDFCWLKRALPTKPVESHHPSCALEEDYVLDLELLKPDRSIQVSNRQINLSVLLPRVVL